MAEPPRNATRRPVFPSFGDRAGHLFCEELAILLNLHDSFFREYPLVEPQFGGRVGMCGDEKDLGRVEVGQLLCDFLTDKRQDIGRNDDDIARNHDRQIQRPIAVARLDDNDVRREWCLYPCRDSQMKLPGQGRRLLGRDFGARGPDEQLGTQDGRRNGKHEPSECRSS